VLLPDNAAAHSPIPGIKGFYLGMVHPLSTPPQLLSLLAAGILLGLRWPSRFALFWLTFGGFALIGLGLGQWGILGGMEDAALLAGSTVASLIAALFTASLSVPCIVLCAWIGLFLGVASAPDEGPAWPSIVTLAGSFTGANLALLHLVFAVGWLRERFAAKWVHIGLRIAAAWLTAIACLMLALLLVTPGGMGTNGQ
jgi:hydrogenase/urease accessory protein HupE